MAETLGVTKGAVSQTLARLVRKGILTKEKDPYNKNELAITLTPLGKRAYAQCQQYAASILAQLEQIIRSFSEDEQEVIERFVAQLANVFTAP
jgi:DNA-binding MarR family transcriptional regulator